MTDEISKGNAAQRILEDQAFLDAAAEYTKQITHKWSTSTNKDIREEMWFQQQALTSVINNLCGFMSDKDYKISTQAKEGFFK